MMAGVNGGGDAVVATPGFRFYPTEEELLGFYLRRRLAGASPALERVIPVVDVYGYHPSQLRSMAGEASARDTEQWFFFCPRAEREAHGGRPARTTPSGYWKATGSPSCVFSAAAAAGGGGRLVGVKRTMVFYQGRAPTGTKTRWKMNEYKLAVAAADDDEGGAAVTAAPLRLRNELSVCRVYISTGTLRSFDRRPLDPSGSGSGSGELRHHHRNHQAESSSATAARLALAGAGAITSTQHGETSQHYSSSSGSRAVFAGGGDEDAAIDWSSLMTAAADDDGFGFNDMGFSSSSIGGAWPQMN